jgi:methyl-accepting chemotaxis protein|nr:MAG TPA: minor tail protein [Caudoviricetes sp.]
MELESLEIKIQAQAQQASGQIDALVTRLGRLSSALSGLSTGNLNSLSTGVNRLAGAMTAMRGIDTRTFSAVARNVSKLGSINSKQINAAAGSMRQISNAVKGLSGMSASVKGLTDLASAIKQLGYQSSTKAIENIPKLATAMRQLMSELSKAPMVSQNLINMTNALAKLARTGGAAGTAAKSITSSFSGFSSGASAVTKKSFSLASAIGKVYATYWTLFRGFRLLGDAIDISSSLTEVENVVRQTFGQYESLINNFAKTSIEKFGMSELSAKQFASRFQAMGTALDIPQGKMAKMSIRLTELAGDMASFYDVSQEDIAKSLQSVFSGTTAPMRRYGIDLTQATLKEWALKQGLDANISSMTQAQKAMLRYQYVLAHTTNITGDFARTADTWHNQITMLKENFKALGAVVGGGLINAFKPFIKVLNAVLQKVISFAEMVTNALGSIFGWKYEASKGAGISGLADDIGSASDGMDDLSDAAGSAGKNTGGIAKNAKKAKKEIQQATRAFDELKVISKQSKDKGSGSGNKGSGSGSGSGAGGGTGADGGLVQTDTIFKKFKSDIKDLEGLGIEIRKALVKAVGGIEWDKIYAKASGFGTGLAEFLNGLFSEDKKGNSVFTATADVIAGALNTAIFASKGFTDKFKFETFGNNIAHGFNRFFKKFKWKKCAEAINGWVDGFWKFVHGFFDDLSWKDIFNGLKIFLTNLTPKSLATILMFSGGKLAPIVSSALCSILGFTSGGKGGKGGKTFKLNGLGLAAFIATIGFQLSKRKTDFTSSVVEALAAGGAAFYMSGGNPYFALAGVTVSVGISLGKFFVEKSDKMKKTIKDFKKKVDLMLGKKVTVTGWDGKKKTLKVPKSQEKNKVKKNAYPSDDESKKRLAENTDWYRKQKEKKEAEKKSTAGMPDEARRFANTQKRNARVRAENKKKVVSNRPISGISSVVSEYAKSKPQKIKLKAEIISADDKIKNKKLKGFTAGLEKGKDGIKLSDKSLKNFTANLSKNKDVIPTKNKSLNNYLANISKNKDKIKSSDKTLANYTASLTGNKDKIPDKYKRISNYTAELIANKDKIKRSDKTLNHFTGTLTRVTDNIKPANKRLGGFTALITSFVNRIKNAVLDFTARLTGKSTKKADGGVFSGGSWKPVKKYAVGGLPNMGQMFVAREAGPELVGTLGGHTAVMNNDQIVSSVSYGVAQAVKEVIQPLLKTSVGNNRPIQISLDGKVIFDSTRQSAQEYFNRTGISPFPV